MSARAFWIGLTVQLIGWPVLFWLTGRLDRWGRGRALAKGKHWASLAELVLVAGVIATLLWIMLPLIRWIRQPHEIIN
jgi:hypothetical protein